MSFEGAIRVFGLDHHEQNELDQLVAQWRSKQPRNKLRTTFYDMHNSERDLLGPAIPAVVRRRRFVLGWSAMAVDKLNRRCNLDGFYSVDGADLSGLGVDEFVRIDVVYRNRSEGGIETVFEIAHHR